MSAVFTPPVVARVPPVLPDTGGVARRLFQHYAPLDQGVNVFVMPDGTVLIDEQPLNLSNADNNPDSVAPLFTYYGGHTYTITDAEAATLSAAGLSEYLS